VSHCGSLLCSLLLLFRTPPPKPRDRPALPVIEEGPKRSQLSEEEKAKRAALLQKYGNAASHKDTQAKREQKMEDDDIVRLGMGR
jgi:hypothetical protein